MAIGRGRLLRVAKTRHGEDGRSTGVPLIFTRVCGCILLDDTVIVLANRACKHSMFTDGTAIVSASEA
jgi:hypothetical protein